MLKRVSGAAVLVAALATGAPVWAEAPMTPLRPTAPLGAPPNAASSTAQPWVEPPPAPTRKMPKPSTTENAAPEVQPEPEPEPEAPAPEEAAEGEDVTLESILQDLKRREGRT